MLPHNRYYISLTEWRGPLKRFLSPLAPEIRHRDVADSLTRGTGKWFLVCPEFESWLKREGAGNQVLSCIGDPGAGKTGLAYVTSLCTQIFSLVCDRCLAFEYLSRLQTSDNSAVAFVYCDHTIQGEQTPTNLIGALLAQLTNRLADDDPVVRELLQRHASNKLVDLNSGIDYIHRVCMSGSLSAVRLGVDGLDELLPEYRSRFLHELANLLHRTDIQFLFFGRDNSGIQADVDRSFGTSDSLPIHFKITGDMTLHDRRIFLEEALQRHKNARTFSPELREMILHKIAPSDST
jgi:hypothetical protein